MGEPYYELLLSGPAGREQTIRAALMNAGVGKDDFVPCHHGWEHLEEERAKGWVAFRADDLQAAEIACKKAKGWRLRIHRHAVGLAIQEQVPGPRIDPLEQIRSRMDGLERMVAGLVADNARLRGEPPPIAGGALESPPWVIKADQHSADLFRQMPQGFLTGSGGMNHGDLLVTPGGSQPPPAVSVAAGQVWIPGTIEGTTGFRANLGAQTSVGNTNGGTSTSTGFPTSFTSQGSYYAYQDAAVSLSITSADPSNPRIDLVCATVQDAEYAGSSNQCVLQVITGTAGASPAPVAPPANSVIACSVWVPAAATSITSGDLNDLRPLIDSGWQTPTFLNSWGYYATQLNKGFRRIGNQVFFHMSIAGGSTATAAFSIPAAYAPPSGAGTVDVNGLAQGPVGECVLSVPAGGGNVYMYFEETSSPLFWSFYGSYLID